MYVVVFFVQAIDYKWYIQYYCISDQLFVCVNFYQIDIIGSIVVLFFKEDSNIVIVIVWVSWAFIGKG